MGFTNSLEGESLHVRRRASGEHPWLEMEAMDTSGVSWLLWYSYRLDDRWYDRPLSLQLRYGVDALIGAPVSSVIAMRTACMGTDCATARTTLQNFAAVVRSNDRQ
jgi:hypothetical protein